jgi:hypothetical protein
MAILGYLPSTLCLSRGMSCRLQLLVLPALLTVLVVLLSASWSGWNASSLLEPRLTPSSILATSTSPLCGPDAGGDSLPLSEDGIDRYARDRFFSGRRRAHFVEVGAGAGDVRFSSSIALERAGWRGLLVEATATRVPDLRKARPLAAVAHATVCDSDLPVHFVEPKDPRYGAAGAGIAEFMPDLFLLSWHPNFTVTSAASTHCESLSSVFRDAGVIHTDFLAIDVVRPSSDSSYESSALDCEFGSLLLLRFASVRK